MTGFDQEKYDAAREAAHNYFQRNQKIQSPVLGTVHLNSDGFLHLVYGDKHHKQKRDWKNQLKRFHLVTYTRRIIEGMGFYQEFLEQYQTVMVKEQKHEVPASKLVKYWGFVAVIDNRIRVKIILRQVGNGNIHFWSVIPFWKTKYYKDIQLTDLSTGDLEGD
ncbi:MAG: hypothetical protein V1926_05485 [Candidatus Peregrinibacteria bacterium]